MANTADTLAAAFKRRFGGDVTVPGDPRYDTARAVWNGTVESRPALVAHCRDAADVVTAVNLSRDCDAVVAVRAGGHSVCGFSSCDDGVVIDLRQMCGVDVDRDRRVAVVGAGATWADFDSVAGRDGLATTGGLVSTTGVAGLTLGGGIGWLQRRYGLACDNVRGARIVTAEGHLLEADDDLLWGLRGGGGNFGVVTSFEFDLHPVSTVLGGMMLFPLERAAEVLRAFRDWAASAPDEATMLAAVNCAPPAPFVPPELVGRPVLVLAGCLCGDDSDAAATALAPLRSLEPFADLFSPMTYPDLQRMLDEGAPSGQRNYFRAGFTADLSDDIIEIVLEHGARLSSPLSQIHLHQMGGAVGRSGTDSSSFSGRDAGFTYNVIGTWLDPTEDDTHTAEVRRTCDALEPHSIAGRYVNFDAETGVSDVHSAYGDQIYTRLARLKRQYDPANLFKRNQNVRPAP
jgi:FAD/FMN-containing dehydrogenase